ncbi:MAG: bL17 family ribosomal protein, partial [Prochlorothrix sp.]
KLITLAKRGDLHARRLAASRLRNHGKSLHRRKADREAWRQNEDVVRILFEELAPGFKGRNGGYTRIIRMGTRQGDAGQTAILEWVDRAVVAAAADASAAPAAEASEKSEG